MSTAPFEVAPGHVRAAKRKGFISGIYACEDHHGVIVVSDERGRPIVEVHMDAEQEAMLLGLIKANRAEIVGISTGTKQ